MGIHAFSMQSLIVAFFPDHFSRVINILSTKLARDRTGRISALSLSLSILFNKTVLKCKASSINFRKFANHVRTSFEPHAPSFVILFYCRTTTATTTTATFICTRTYKNVPLISY